MTTYLWRRIMVWTTWRLAALNKALDHWNSQLRERAILSRAEYVVESERRRMLTKRLTGKEPVE